MTNKIDFNVGKDNVIKLVDPNGVTIVFPYILGFDCKPDSMEIKFTTMAGKRKQTSIVEGYSGKLEVARASAAVDQLNYMIDSSYRQNGQCVVFTMYQYITEKDGSVSSWEYTNVSFKISDLGSWKGNADVKQTLEFFAEERNPL